MNQPRPIRRPYLVAVVLGTALAALGTAEKAQAVESISPQAINNLSRYCTVCWKNARLPIDQWGDCTQEVLTRLLQTLPAAKWTMALARESEERRELIRAIDAVKKRHQRQRGRTQNLNDAVLDARDAHERRRADDHDAWKQAAQELLSERQQRILQRFCEGHEVAEIAGEMNLSPERVSDEKYKAIQKLRSRFLADTETNG
jgi:RNA polymerase sigma factor (sigma-70 family)